MNPDPWDPVRTSPPRKEAVGPFLARLGFLEPDRARRVLGGPRLAAIADDRDVVEAFGLAAEPDLALRSLDRIMSAADAATADALRDAFLREEGLRTRLALVLGASEALGEHLVRHPGNWPVLRDSECGPVGPTREEVVADMRGAVADLPVAEASLALRVAYRRRLLALTARDLSGTARFTQVTEELADLADGVLAASLDIAASALGPEAAACRFAVIALGKCGGRELNYVSDVDVVFVAEPAELADGSKSDESAALDVGTRLARGLMRAANEVTSEGTIWEVDAGLRPEGKAGALVRTLASHLGYYERWAQTWEFQALLKARVAAGDAELGEAYLDGVAPLVWSAADRANFVADVQTMRQRVEAHIPAERAQWQLKLGRGGLRDVEFSVQLLQLVHGRSDVMLRSPNTMTALEALAVWGYVGRDDAAALAGAYRFLRTLEHRMQLYRLRRISVVPDDPVALRRLGRSMGMRADPAAELLETWRGHARTVRRLHEKLFYRPLLNAVAQLDSSAARLTREAATERLTALGYVDPDGALRNLEALTTGVGRRAIIQRTLLPVMLGWFADGPDPDAGLLGFRQVSESLGATPWYLRLLRDESAVAQRMANLLSTSRYASDLLVRVPEFVGSLSDVDTLRPVAPDALRNEMGAVAARAAEAHASISVVRSVRRRELLRLAAADIEGIVDVAQVGLTITQITDASIDRAIDIATRQVEMDTGVGPGQGLQMRLAVIAMGRLGGSEMSYASDADVMFVYEPQEGCDPHAASQGALAVANLVIELLQGPGPDPALAVDTALRPEGRMGPLVRSLDSYAEYYRRWSSPWEAQALLRARFCAGASDVADGLASAIDPLRYPQAGIGEAGLREIRRLKARMESERLPRGTDPAMHIKLGRGGLSDVEWVAQLVQLRHGHAHQELRVTNTVGVLQAAGGLGLMEPSDVRVLSEAWTFATRVRNAITLVTGRAADVVPSDPRVVAGVAHVLGHQKGDLGAVSEAYLRVTRRSRSVVERLFYGWE